VPTQAEASADDAPLDAISIEEDGVGPPPSDNTRSPHRDLVAWGINFGTLGQTTLGDMVPTPEYSGAMGPGVARLLLSGYPGSLFPPVNWGLVESSVEYVCLLVEATKRMLQETLDAVEQNILCPIRVSLKKSENFTYALLASFESSYTPFIFASAAPVPGCCWRAYALGGGNPGVRGYHCYGGHPC
jgi:hypothetical protein